MDREPDDVLENQRGIIEDDQFSCAAQLYRSLGCFPCFDTGDAAGPGQRADYVVLDGDADPFELLKVEIDSRLAQQPGDSQIGDEVSHGQAVGLGAKDVFGGQQSRCAALVFNEDLRVAGNIFAPVASDSPRINVEAASRRGTYHDSHNLALIKRLRGECRIISRKQTPNRNRQHRRRDRQAMAVSFEIHQMASIATASPNLKTR